MKKVVGDVTFKGYTPPRKQRRASVFPQERQNRSRRDSQRRSASALESISPEKPEETIATEKGEKLGGVSL
jgi:hypothetical protein